MMQVLVARLEHTAAAMPTHTAIQKGARRIDYRGLREAALHLAVVLRTRGVQPGDRVALSLSNGIEAAIAWYGIWRAGAAVVPMNAQARERDFVPWLRHTARRLLVHAVAPGDAGQPAHIPGVPTLGPAMV